jgi:hypothetical protein
MERPYEEMVVAIFGWPVLCDLAYGSSYVSLAIGDLMVLS